MVLTEVSLLVSEIICTVSEKISLQGVHGSRLLFLLFLLFRKHDREAVCSLGSFVFRRFCLRSFGLYGLCLGSFGLLGGGSSLRCCILCGSSLRCAVGVLGLGSILGLLCILFGSLFLGLGIDECLKIGNVNGDDVVVILGSFGLLGGVNVVKRDGDDTVVLGNVCILLSLGRIVKIDRHNVVDGSLGLGLHYGSFGCCGSLGSALHSVKLLKALSVLTLSLLLSGIEVLNKLLVFLLLGGNLFKIGVLLGVTAHRILNMLARSVHSGKFLLLALLTLSLSLCLRLEPCCLLLRSHSSSLLLLFAELLSVVFSKLHFSLLLLEVSFVLRLVFLAATLKLLLSCALFALCFRFFLLLFLTLCSRALAGVIKSCVCGIELFTYRRCAINVDGSVFVLHFFAHFSSLCQKVYGFSAICLCHICFDS